MQNPTLRSIRPPPLLLLAGLALCACATDYPKPPVCDGAHRRPVNLYPSVLGSGAPEHPGALGPAAPTPPAPATSHGGC